MAHSRAAVVMADMSGPYADVLARLVGAAGSSAGRWAQLVELFDQIPAQDMDRLIEQLTTMDVSAWSDRELDVVSSAARKLATQHLRFPDAPWAMEGAQAQRLLAAAASLQPEDLVLRERWLFDDHVELPGPVGDDWETEEALVRQEQARAVERVLKVGGIELVLPLALAVAAPWRVGLALADVADRSDAAAIIRVSLRSTDLRALTFLRGYLLRHFDGSEVDDIREILDHVLLQEELLSPAARGLIWSAGPFDEALWRAVDGDGAEVRDAYWNTVALFGRGALDGATVDAVAAELLRARNYQGALGFLALYREVASPDLVLQGLTAITDREVGQSVRWDAIARDLLSLMERLQVSDVDQDRVAILEWQLVPFISVAGYEPRTLQTKLQREPDFFNEVLALAFRGEQDESNPQAADPDPELQQKRAQRALELLWEWRRPPGLTSSGQMDRKLLFSWVRTAREQAARSGRLRICDERIGAVLAHAPAADDGIWPDLPVRDLLDDNALASESLRNGLVIGVQNSVGVTSRLLGAGGGQERERASRYKGWGESVRDRWPQTGAVLSRIAEAFEGQGRREDMDAAMEHHEWGPAAEDQDA